MELLYHFFKKRRLLLALLTATVFGVALWGAFQVRIENDLSRIIPLDKQLSKTHEAIQSTQITESIIFHAYTNDSSDNRADTLIVVADSFVHRLQTDFMPQYISSLRYSISDTSFFSIYNGFYEHLPIFLSDEDYKRLAPRLQADSIRKTLEGAYKTLLSPTGFFMKKNVLRDPLALTTIPLQKLRTLQVNNDFTIEQNRIFSKDLRHLIFVARPAFQANNTDQNAQFYTRLDSLVKQFNGNIKIEYFSGAAVAVANASQVKADVEWTMVIALTLLVLFISFFFRRWFSFLIIFLPVAIGGAVGFAVLYLWFGTIAGIALGAGCILLGIAVDFSLHFLTHVRTVGSPAKALRDVTQPVAMSSITTGAAFFCLLGVSSEALRGLGVFAGVSVLSSAFFALLLLPHFVPENQTPVHENAQKTSLLERLLAYPFHRSRVVVLSVVVFSVFCFLYRNNVGFETDLMRINYMSEPLKIAEEHLKQMSAQSSSTHCVVRGKTLDEALENQQQILPKLDSLQKAGFLTRYFVPTSFLQSSSQQKQRIEAWNRFWTAERKTQIRTLLIEQGAEFKFKDNAFDDFYKLLDSSFEPAQNGSFAELRSLVLDEYITEKPDFTTLLIPLWISDTHRDQVFQSFAAEKDIAILDRRHLTNEFIRILANDFNLLAWWSFIVVFVVLLLFFGRSELAVLTFIPVLLGWVWTLGIMGLFGWNFNIIDIIVCTFISGLGVDYSIFMARGMLHEYTYGEKVLNSYKVSIFLSALTTLLGMGALIFAQHPALYSVAKIALVGIVSVLVIPYVVLPMLFRFFIVGRAEKGLAPYTLSSLTATVVAYGYFLFGCLLLGVLILLLSILPIPLRGKKVVFHKVLQLFSKSLIFIMFNVKKVWINVDIKSLDKPAVIIANHQSFLDIMLMVSLHPKIVLMTNDWVWNSPFFGRVVKYADFYPVSSGAENSVEQLKVLYERGFSIMIFPEGTRSPDGNMKRFKKGAFFLAEQLGADIQPIILHSTGGCIKKHDLLVNSNTVTIKFLPRIAANDKQWGTEYQERTKNIAHYFKQEYYTLCEQVETPRFYATELIKNYIYKGPVLEWYVRIKARLESYYELFHQIIPRKAIVTDIGAGYGMMAYMLHFLSKEREITALDYDKEKIELAQNCFSRTPKVRFVAADATQFEYQNSDVFLISDMLHYIPTEQQHSLIRRCLDKLNAGGMLIIRDGDRDLAERHKGTELTEKWSTGIGFNQMKSGRMFYLSGKEIESIAAEYGLSVERIDRTQKTSNIIFIIRKPIS